MPVQVVYVASSNMTDADVDVLTSLGMRVLHRSTTWGPPGGPVDVETERELAAAVDFFILRISDLFMGNCFSSFSWMLRELDYATRTAKDTPARSLYYNQPMLFTAGTLM